MKRSFSRIATKGTVGLGRVVRGIYYRTVFLSWVKFGRGVVFAGPIECLGVTGSISIGDGVFLGTLISLSVADGGSIIIGDDCSINKLSTISAMNEVRIGARTRIAENVSIRDNDHQISAQDSILSSGFRVAPISIGPDVWIGRNCTIMPGCTIGSGAVIGANSFVNQDVPPNAVAVGTPARIKRIRQP